METITSANASLILTVETLYPSGVQIQQFAADSAFATEDIVVAESRMGVDGHLASGYTPNPIPLNISLEANSPSRNVLSNIFEKQQLNMSLYQVTATITIPALHKEYTLSAGVMNSGHPFPDAKKTLDPTQWRFTFEKISSASI